MIGGPSLATCRSSGIARPRSVAAGAAHHSADFERVLSGHLRYAGVAKLWLSADILHHPPTAEISPLGCWRRWKRDALRRSVAVHDFDQRRDRGRRRELEIVRITT